ncbi:MAG: hypothetical protein BAJALOKI1v1_1240004 [Promethearchaeota archaeon]|nr:MAG: hypothetical protein BAJALOKI1v1_1240004 [Candidatus Lokiarchaeota archaeon]
MNDSNHYKSLLHDRNKKDCINTLSSPFSFNFKKLGGDNGLNIKALYFTYYIRILLLNKNSLITHQNNWFHIL